MPTKPLAKAIYDGKANRYWLQETRKHIPIKACLQELCAIAFETTGETLVDLDGKVVTIKQYRYETKLRLHALETLLAKALPDLKAIDIVLDDKNAPRPDFALLAIAAAAVQNSLQGTTQLKPEVVEAEFKQIAAEQQAEQEAAMLDENPFELIDQLDSDMGESAFGKIKHVSKEGKILN